MFINNSLSVLIIFRRMKMGKWFKRWILFDNRNLRSLRNNNSAELEILKPV